MQKMYPKVAILKDFWQYFNLHLQKGDQTSDE